MKKYEIIWSPKFFNDLEKIHFYIEYYLLEKNIADKIVKKILDSVSTLSYFPEKHMKIQKSNKQKENIRRMPVGNFIVIYKVDSDTRASLCFTYFSFKSKL